jgi:hypothetical protein
MISSLMVFLDEYAVWFVVASSISFITGLLLLPFFLTRIPVDYFSHHHRHHLLATSCHPLIRLLITGLKNLLGIVFVVAGFLMLFLPGQGILMLLVGLIIMNYPGKFALENWLIRRTFVLPAVNWLRAKYNHPPLLVSPDNEKK